MDIRFLSPTTVTPHSPDELAALLGRDDGLVWVDIPTWDAEAERVLTDVFKLHPLAVRDCRERNTVPKVHVYADHVFVVLHAPELGARGHVHYVELDQFIGRNYLITVHGPLNPAVSPDAAMIEVRAVLARIESGRLRPTSPQRLSHAIVSALTARLRNHTAALTREVWSLEQRVTAGQLEDPEEFLEEMFRTRHGLLSARTMCALSREVYGRMATIAVFRDTGQSYVEDIVDQFDRLRAMADAQKDYLQGTIEFYQARTNTKMTIAAERLTVIAAITLPITALSSILGMNVIVSERSHFGFLMMALAVMLAMSTALLVWVRRKGWW
ncbi:magnesium transporter CorA family protein [Vitiosangium sp. GDMCC 1.1324]|uniref:magnesium transporter CorA family protein n=1 Tax=Vitiosangium sp. (strain GDMCC 1.1324) TaxID=2138576 RepID=UPI000D3C744F|nr:magnesium transporter CorA family protein [Vitiosangium sp. GDMCC 1.1324]PTL76058.1 magnesium transporter [Vitiosangium sp. GDMCC 1.1324]